MQLVAYLSFPGNCEEAINFYKDALDGKVLQKSTMGDSPMEVPPHLANKIMHARLEFGGNLLFMSDTFDPSTITKGNTIGLSLNFEKTKEFDEVWKKLSAGGSIKMPPDKTYWAARFGMLTDKYGVNWMLNQEKEC